MVASNKYERLMRCPVCFSRETDVLMIPEDEGHYCVKCGFRGSEARVRELYADIKKSTRV